MLDQRRLAILDPSSQAAAVTAMLVTPSGRRCDFNIGVASVIVRVIEAALAN